MSSEGAKETLLRGRETRMQHHEPWRELQLRASVRVDFAVQANFFKSRCGPFHDSPSGPMWTVNSSLAYRTLTSKSNTRKPPSDLTEITELKTLAQLMGKT